MTDLHLGLRLFNLADNVDHREDVPPVLPFWQRGDFSHLIAGEHGRVFAAEIRDFSQCDNFFCDFHIFVCLNI